MITVTKKEDKLLIIQNNMSLVLSYLFVPLATCVSFFLYSLLRLSSPFEANFMMVLAFIVAYTIALKTEWKRKIYISKNVIEIITYPFQKKTSIKFSEIEEIKVEILEKDFYKYDKADYINMRDSDILYKIVLFSSDEKFHNYILCHSLYLTEMNEVYENILKYREEITR